MTLSQTYRSRIAAVVVDVRECRAAAQRSGIDNAGRLGRVLEAPRRDLFEELVWPVLRDQEQVGQTVVIDVADRQTSAGQEVVLDVLAVELVAEPDADRRGIRADESLFAPGGRPRGCQGARLDPVTGPLPGCGGPWFGHRGLLGGGILLFITAHKAGDDRQRQQLGVERRACHSPESSPASRVTTSDSGVAVTAGRRRGTSATLIFRQRDQPDLVEQALRAGGRDAHVLVGIGRPVRDERVLLLDPAPGGIEGRLPVEGIGRPPRRI